MKKHNDKENMEDKRDSKQSIEAKTTGRQQIILKGPEAIPVLQAAVRAIRSAKLRANDLDVESASQEKDQPPKE